MRGIIATAFLFLPAVLAPNAEPTVREIEQAYRSRSGEGGVLPGYRWEIRRVKRIRGWAVRFEFVSQKNDYGSVTRRYQAVARKAATSATYQITETIPTVVGTPVKPVLVVRPDGVRACH